MIVDQPRMAFAIFGCRFTQGAIHCGMIDAIMHKIHREFGLPEQTWKFTPPDWSTANGPSGALNYQAGMRSSENSKLPLLPQTHPDGMAWGEKEWEKMSYRQIFDQRRQFIGRSPKTATAPLRFSSGYTTTTGDVFPEIAPPNYGFATPHAGTGYVPTLASVSSVDDRAMMSVDEKNPW